MDIKARDYVAAGQTRGEGPWYIMLWEILPNARGPLIVDFCLRIVQCGYFNVWTPRAELYHHESASRGLEDNPVKQARFMSEVEFMQKRWSKALQHDPAYSPNLSLTQPFALES